MCQQQHTYDQDWILIAAVASEMAAVRERFGLSDFPTGEEITAVWDDIFRADGVWPNLRRVGQCLLSDERLHGHLGTCFWYHLTPAERRGFDFSPPRDGRAGISRDSYVLPAVLVRLVLMTWRNAETWQAGGGTHPRWTRFWHTEGLTKELRRTIQELDRRERGHGEQGDGNSPTPEPTTSPARKRAEYSPKSPEQVAEFLAACCRGLTEPEAAAFREWYWSDWSESEPDAKEYWSPRAMVEERIARKHGLTADRLREVVLKVCRNKY